LSAGYLLWAEVAPKDEEDSLPKITPMNRPVATLLIVTLAPLITAPDGSLTVPTMLPVPTVVCPGKRVLAFTSRRKAKASRTLPAVFIVMQPIAAGPLGA